MKPMLPRNLTSSARINLNQYWNVLEEMVPCDVTTDTQGDDADMSNEINENLANEILEQSRDLSSTCKGSHDNPGGHDCRNCGQLNIVGEFCKLCHVKNTSASVGSAV
jgi:hypothetical protein